MENRVDSTSEITRMADEVGRPTLPALAALAYGVFEFFRLGLSPSYFLQTYVLVFGSIASLIAIQAYVGLARIHERSWGGAIAGLGGMIPWLFSLYLMAYQGAFRGWLSLTEKFTVLGLMAAIFWLLAGYRLLYTFWQITERVKRVSVLPE